MTVRWSLVAGLPLTIGIAIAAFAPPALAAPTVLKFGYTGAPQTWTVPAGVWSVSFDVLGGQGADAAVGLLRASGGLGGEATAAVPVTPGETFQIDVGGAGESNPSAGGFNDGSGGGGGSDVRIGPFALGDRVIVAGGGGGSGGDDAFGDVGGGGGAGGGGSGTAGAALLASGGGGGGGASTGSGGSGGSGAGGGHTGTAGILLSGGVGGASGSGVPGSGGFNGGAGGGAGNPGAGQTGAGGGGGGGGLYGGGGGGSAGGQLLPEGGGGGGGGASAGPPGAVFEPGVQTGDGGVSLTYTPSTLALGTHVAPSTIAIGETFDDTATLGPPPTGAPPPTGSVTFDVYGAGDASCTASPVLSSTVALDAAGTSAVSAAFKPADAGTYHVTASYAGDQHYLPETSGCADAGASVTVTKAAVALHAQVAPATIAIGGTFDDTATLGPPPAGAPPPAGSVTFDVYGAGDPSCTASPAFSSTDALDAAGTTAVSAAFKPTAAGTYHVTASYAGDANHLAAASGCTDPAGTLTVAALPSVTSIAPASGPPAGGTTVTLSGSNLGPAPTVDFGAAAASQVEVNAAGTTITAIAPAGTGVAGVSVVTAGGRSAVAAADQYAYVGPPVVSGLSPSEGPVAGGTSVTITGGAFTGATAVDFGSVPASEFSVDGPDQITASAPAGSGSVDVRVTTPAGVSAIAGADRYTYTPAPPPPPPASPSPSPTPPPTATPTTTAVTAVASSLAATPEHPVSDTGTPTVLGSSGARFTATIDPEGLATTMHFEYAIQPAGASAAAVTYTAQTPQQVVGSDFSEHTVTATVADLAPGSVYHVRAVAANSSGVTAGADATFTTARAVPPAPPALGKSFNAQPVSGTVRFYLPAHTTHAESLNQALSLPVGTVIDATHGTLRLTSATATKGRTQSGEFGGGRFKFLQDRREDGLTELSLIDPTGAGSGCAAPRGHAEQAAKRQLPKADLVLLRASAKGRFEVHGHYSSATVRGTSWTTSNRCDGTFTSVKLGVVVVHDFRRNRLILLRSHHSYLAKAP